MVSSVFWRSTGVLFLLFSLSRSTPTDKGKDDLEVKHVSKRCFGRWHPGRWSFWGQWSKCPVQCGFGLISRSRVCHHVVPFDCCGSCFGSDTEYSVCVNLSACKAVTQKPKTTKVPSTKPTTNPITVFKQTTKQRQKTTVPKYAWATINISGRKFVWRGK